MNAALTFDAFTESDYPNLDQQYFHFRDYETLFEKNKKRKDADITRRRKEVQQKLLAIDALVQKPMGKLGLVHHWRSENITSTIMPQEYNRYQVEWCGVRYTRKETAQYIKEMKLAGDGYGFPKYACLQFCLIPRGFEINLFHAVRHEAVDRNYFQDAILNKEFCRKVEAELEKVQGYGLWWYAGDSSFSVDDEDPGDFVSWYRANDTEGSETYLAYHYEPDDSVLESKQTVADTFVEYAKLLVPLFDTVSSRWNKSKNNSDSI